MYSYERLHYTVDIVLAFIIAGLVLALHHVLLALCRFIPLEALRTPSSAYSSPWPPQSSASAAARHALVVVVVATPLPLQQVALCDYCSGRRRRRRQSSSCRNEHMSRPADNNIIGGGGRRDSSSSSSDGGGGRAGADIINSTSATFKPRIRVRTL